ncbi:putative membrane protein [Limnoglobus roseus]|uniref:Putative membrane protein n=1 Tax=Limnoglobus roseus TaxID=2598579 RepID=A0A5C1AG53_9BACT|nr:DoxX family protein [Limnoglobus roseus]QEL17800.1 putative membrane protein [Limnoglobus roseus]
MTAYKRVLATDAPPAVLLVRLMVGGVFLSEGVQKFLYPDLRGAGRFATLGIPSPEFFGPFVGVFEVVCGALILIGLLTRLAVVPTICIMLVAIYSTQLPVLEKEGF